MRAEDPLRSSHVFEPRRTTVRITYIVIGTVLALGLGWVVFQMAGHSVREGSEYRALVLMIPIAVFGIFAAFLAVVGRGGGPRATAASSIGRRLVLGATALAVLLIVAGILLYAGDFAPDNQVATSVVAIAAYLVTPFRFLFLFNDNGLQVALNWGIGAATYLVLGILTARAVDWLSAGRSPSAGSEAASGSSGS